MAHAHQRAFEVSREEYPFADHWLERVEEASHYLQEDAPERVAAAVRRALERREVSLVGLKVLH